MKKIFMFIFILLTLVVGVIVGFKIRDSIQKNNTKVVDDSKASNNKVEEVKPVLKNDSKDPIDVIIDKTTSNVDTNTKALDSIEKTYTNTDNKVIDKLSTALDDIKNSEVTESFKDSCKATFIKIVDFLFYDGKIGDVTFKELSESGKEKVLAIASDIDNAIESKVPNYKETISDKTKNAYNEASKLIKKGSVSLDNFMKEKLSEENYNAIIDAKDDLVYYTKNAFEFVKDNGGKIINNAKNKLAEWYKTLKD